MMGTSSFYYGFNGVENGEMNEIYRFVDKSAPVADSVQNNAGLDSIKWLVDIKVVVVVLNCVNEIAS